MSINELYDKYKDGEFSNDKVREYIAQLNEMVVNKVQEQGDDSKGIYATSVVEVNRIHNAVMDMFIANGKQPPLMSDAFLIYWRMMSPGIKTLV